MPDADFDFDHYHQAIDDLRLLNLAARRRFAGIENLFITAGEFSRTHATVRCSLGRMTGHSHYIQSRAQPADLIVTVTRNAGGHLFPGAACKVLSATQIKNLGDNIDRFETIYVDEPSFVFAIIPDKTFYSALSKDIHQTFVLLGS